MRRTLRIPLAVVAAAVMLAAFAVFLAVFQLPADAATTTAGPPPVHWLISTADLARTAAAGPVPAFQWNVCSNEVSGNLPCKPGQVPTFTDYYKFRRWVLAGGSGEVLLDYEGWSLTPHWQQVHMWRYIRLSGQLAVAHHIGVISSPVNPTTDEMIMSERTAAAAGAEVVDLQRQWMRSPAAYLAFAQRAVRAIHAANPRTLVIAGLAADPDGRPMTATRMVRIYTALRPVVAGFWLNASVWSAAKGGTGCAPRGCPLTVLAFLRAIGA